MEEISVKSTSLASAECSDVVLRETKITRLVFRPLFIDNQKSPSANVKGTFLFQRKSSKDAWEDTKTIRLSSLKAGEGFKLEIKSEELKNLTEELNALYEFRKDAGLPRGQAKWVKATPRLAELAKLSGSDISDYLRANREVGTSLLSKLLNWAIKLDEPTALVDHLVELGHEAVKKLNAAVGLQSLKDAHKIWKDNESNSDEEFWQKSLTEYSFVLEQVFSWPASIVKGKAYVGGKSIENSGGKLVDFLMRNQITHNAALIEIKTPITPLLGGAYRDGVYNISGDLSGAFMQILNYKHSLLGEYNALTSDRPDLFTSFNPLCVIIIGNAKGELDNKEKMKSFELYRNQLNGVLIITYDELYNKAGNLIKMLEQSKSEDIKDFIDDDIPF